MLEQGARDVAVSLLMLRKRAAALVARRYEDSAALLGGWPGSRMFEKI
jgi:hypothetical protein